MKNHSKSLQILKTNEGFTLIELTVVVLILGVLGSFGIGNITRWLKLSKIDQASTLLSNSLVECLQSTRAGTDPTTVAPPSEIIDNNRLESSGYKIKASKDKCAEFFITPIDDNEDVLFEMGYQITADSQVTKIATPADDQSSLVRCKRWAGPNCGASEEQKAAWAAAAALAAEKKKCTDDFYNWLNGPPQGTTTDGNPKYRWNTSENKCNLATYSFEGTIFGSQSAVNAAIEAKLGAACTAKVLSQKDLDPPTEGIVNSFTECPGKTFYFCEGVDKLNETDMTACQNENKSKICQNNIDAKAESGYSGKWGPDQHGLTGPAPCGTTYWMCNKAYTESESAYNSGPCFSSGGGSGGGGSGGGSGPTTEECLDKMPPAQRGLIEIFCAVGIRKSHPFCPAFFACMGS